MGSSRCCTDLVVKPCVEILGHCSYIVYCDDVEIASVAGDTLKFTHTNRMRGWPYTYRYDMCRPVVNALQVLLPYHRSRPCSSTTCIASG